MNTQSPYSDVEIPEISLLRFILDPGGERGTAAPLMGPADPGSTIPLMGPATAGSIARLPIAPELRALSRLGPYTSCRADSAGRQVNHRVDAAGDVPSPCWSADAGKW